MSNISLKVSCLLIIILCSPLTVSAVEEKGDKPPATKVVVAPVSKGLLAPESEFTGTVYYRELSNIACEVAGRADVINAEEGRRVKKGDILVKLNSELLKKSLHSKRSSYMQALASLEKAKKDLKRAENLYKEESVSEQFLDENIFKARSLENQVASLLADVERTDIEIRKTSVRAPFDGIVLERTIERGEWCKEGATAAVIAEDKLIDVIADVPEQITRYLFRDMTVQVKAGGRSVSGKIYVVIPKGDVSTRSFPVKIRVENDGSLIEGMEATVSLPTDKKTETFTVNRDAIISKFGKNVIFTVSESKAVMVPVIVVGYSGLTAGIKGENLSEGMQVIVKGNERVRDGQEVSATK